MVYYPLTTLMSAGIRDIVVITTRHDQHAFRSLLKDGQQWGINLSYAIQEEPRGLAEAFVIAKDFIGGGLCCLILGDNIFYGQGLTQILECACARRTGATVFGYWVKNPERYGVAEFDEQGRVVGLEEKPKRPRSNYAVTGLYFYDEQVVEFASHLSPSPRGELEITDINKLYLDRQQLYLEKLGRGTAWLDTGTHESLMQAGNFIQTIEARQGLRVACPEEIAYTRGWIDQGQLENQAIFYKNNGYGDYLLSLIQHSVPP